MYTAILLLLVTAAQLQQPAPPRDTAPSRRGSASITGRVTEQESGRPLARAIVTLTPNGGAAPTETLTDADGRYEFNGIEPGEYGVTAGPGELRATHLRQAFGKSSPMTLFSSPSRSGVDVKDGEVRSGVDIALRRALAIEGRVLDPWDQPMSNVRVHAVRPDGVPGAGDGAYSDDRGEFRLYGLTPGRYRVCATAQGEREPRWSDSSRFVRTCHPASLSDANAADVILTSRDAVGIDIRVQRSGTFTLSGSVVDAAGEPAGGVNINANEMEDRSVSSSGTSTGGAIRPARLDGGTVYRHRIRRRTDESH